MSCLLQGSGLRQFETAARRKNGMVEGVIGEIEWDWREGMGSGGIFFLARNFQLGCIGPSLPFPGPSVVDTEVPLRSVQGPVDLVLLSLHPGVPGRLQHAQVKKNST